MKYLLPLLLFFSVKGFSQKDSVSNYYEIETIPTPKGLRAETGGIAVLSNGKVVATFHLGEVMIYDPKTKIWKLFAEGLHDALGILPISEYEMIVMQRPEMTRLRDTNKDGVADRYETITDDFGLSGNYHEFAFGPIKDKKGNLFISLNTASNGAGIRKEIRGNLDTLGRPGRMYACVPYRGWVMKLTPDGKLHPFASGFRSPNGLGFDKDGRLFVSDNQGDWRGTSPLYHVEEGKFYGHPSSLVWKADFPRINPLKLPVATLDSMRTKESVAFPQNLISNSPTQPLLDETNGKFGPFAQQLFIGEMDYPHLMRVLMEEVNGQMQGACIPFFEKCGIRRGNNRLAFAPDGSLWIGQNDHGWVGAEGIQHIKWKGKTPMDVMAMNLTKEGFEFTFTLPVERSIASNPANYICKRYYYEYHQAYGSKQFDVTPIPIKAVQLSEDGKKVSLQLAELKAGYVYDFLLPEIPSASNKEWLLNRTIFYKVNEILD